MHSDLERAGTQYAEALIEITDASKNNSADELLLDLYRVKEVLSETPDFGFVINHPAIPTQEKKKLLVDLFGSKVGDLTMRLIELLADKRRLELLPYVERSYRNLLRAKHNIVSATITTAEPLSQDEIAQFKATLTAKLGKEIDLHTDVNKALIAGQILQIGDEILDGSIKGKLRALERALSTV